MQNLKQTKWFLSILLIGVLMYSCSQDEQIDATVGVLPTENFVSLDEASSIASVIEYPLSSNPKNTRLRVKGVPNTFKEIEKALAVPDKEGNSAYYIMNYKDGGFIMISADNRTHPIRAYSLTGKFPMTADKLPSGLLGWLAETSDMISQIRMLGEEQTELVAQSWNPSEIQKSMKKINSDEIQERTRRMPDDHDDCESIYITVGPLLQTTWGQWDGYNNLIPHTGCNSFNGRAPTGCVATAMAQVMKFHEYPTNYNWDNMPNGSGTNETSRLMRDIGEAVNMKWACGGSGAKISDATSAFSSTFGYQNAYCSSFNRETVKHQLNYNRPVILSGYLNKNCFLWWCSYSGGHAWVCDGYKKIVTYNEDCSGGWGYLFLYMNWGWDNNSDGWFSFNNWNLGDRAYNYKKRMVYNIKP